MNLDNEMIAKAVSEVLSRMERTKAEHNWGIFESMDDAIEAADTARLEYLGRTMTERAKYVQAIREVVLKRENLEYMSEAAVEETGIGAFEYKVAKNTLAAQKTPGVEDLTTDAISGDDGLTVVEYSPYGVIGAITPTTNPTETIICNTICMLAAGNAVVFSPHPRAKNVSVFLVREINKALAEVGAPANLVVTVAEPSLENTDIMMRHPKVRMLVATGGPGIVKKVLQSGKKAIGAGAGNPPVVVDETADLAKAARDIVDGCSLDNNVPCIAEKEVLAVESIADELIAGMKANGGYLMTDKALIERMAELVVSPGGNGPKPEFVGKSACCILKLLGVEAPAGTRVILLEAEEQSVFVQEELLMPILPVVRVPDAEEAIAMAVRVEHGNRHTAIMHSRNVDRLTKMAKLIQTTIFVKNGPSYSGIGLGGMGYTTFTIAGPTGEGLTSPRSFARKRRCVLVGGLNVR